MDEGRARCLQKDGHGTVYSGDSLRRPMTESLWAEASKASSKAPLNQPRPPSHLPEAPGHTHSKGNDSVPSKPEAQLKQATLWRPPGPGQHTFL